MNKNINVFSLLFSRASSSSQGQETHGLKAAQGLCSLQNVSGLGLFFCTLSWAETCAHSMYTPQIYRTKIILQKGKPEVKKNKSPTYTWSNLKVAVAAKPRLDQILAVPGRRWVSERGWSRCFKSSLRGDNIFPLISKKACSLSQVSTTVSKYSHPEIKDQLLERRLQEQHNPFAY